jgi:thiamine transport system permease protein
VDAARDPLIGRRRQPIALRVALAGVPAGFLLVFYAWPLATLIRRVVGSGTASAAVHRTGLGDIIWFTFWQAVVSTAATLVVGLLPAWLLARWAFPGRRALSALVTVPFLMPTVVVGAAFVALLPDRLHGTATAIVIAHVFFNIAVVVRVVGALWSQLPDDLAGAARTLGAGRWRAFREVTLPLLAPSIIAAASIIFLFTFTSFGVVQVLGGPANPTLEVEIARRATQLGDIGGAAVLAIIQLAVLGVLITWSAWSQRRASITFGLVPGRRRRIVTAAQRRSIAAIAIGTGLLVVVPLATLAIQSVRPGAHWSLRAWKTLGSSQIRPGLSLGVDPVAALATSLRYMAGATVVSVVLGGLASLAIAAAGRRGGLLDVGLMLPLGTSAVTIGLGMLITFDHAPVDWRAEPWLVPLGHALVATPFVVRAALPVLRARPIGWIDAAATLGASPVRAWWHVDVALLRRPLVVGAGFAAAISLGEFGATTFLSRTGRETMPIVIARLLGHTGDIPRAQAFAMASILAALTTVVILGVEVLQRDPSRD